MWHDTDFTRRFDRRYPIVQGPFGGGLSSPRLTAIVSDAGGLGSFGAQGLPPDRLRAVVDEIRALTAEPFAVNLWVSTADARAEEVSQADHDAAVAALAPFYAELGVAPPPFAPAAGPAFEDQAAALIEARPPVFSFIFGVPSPAILDRCRSLGIRTVGTATTVDEARALDAAGVDAIVATGSEAGGHRPSFLRSAEASLTSTFALVPQVADAVSVPILAAGGIADGRGVAAALALGAHAVQIGTAFLACDESNAPPAHREALRHAAQGPPTMLTRGFTGRLGRGIRNALAEAFESPAVSRLPYPFQGNLISVLKQAALARGRSDLVPFWSGQSAPLVRHTQASKLFESLVRDAGAVSAVRHV
jgi:nitronate monooxygenase